MRRDGRMGLILGGGALLVGVLVFGVALGTAIAGGATGAGETPASSPPEEGAAAPGAPVSGDAARGPTPAGGEAAEGAEGAMADASPSAAGRPASAAGDRTALSQEVVQLAVARAPFEEDRRAPARRYTLPGDEPPPPPPAVELPPLPDFALLGAVSSTEGGWAIVRVGEGTPRMVAEGDVIEGYRVASIDPELAVFAGMGRSVQVPLAQPSATVAAPEPTRRTRNTRGRNDDEDRDEPAAPASPAQLLQQLQGNFPGGLPEAAGQILSRLGAQGAQVRIEGNQVIMQGPAGEQIRFNPQEGRVQMLRLQRGAGGGQ